MFIVCSNCDFKYLVNSADLKPNGRMVECANCGHQWFQEQNEQKVFSAVPSTNKENVKNAKTKNDNINETNKTIKNLPSTIVREEKPSIKNSLIVIFLMIFIFGAVWTSRSYGINTFVLIEFYIREFIFNINLIISDLAKIIHNTLN